MLALRNYWLRRLARCGLVAVCVAGAVPSSAEAQVFGGRVRNWLRGTPPGAERVSPREAVIIERRYVEPQIVLPGDREPAYEEEARYSDRGRNDYGPGVSDRYGGRRPLAGRGRLGRAYDIAEEFLSDQRIERDADGRRSVLRAPADRRERDDIAEDLAEEREDIVEGRRLAAERLPADARLRPEADLSEVEGDYRDVEDRRASERTVRVDRFEGRATVAPPEDPYEEELPTPRRSDTASRERAIDERELSLEDARGRRAADPLAEDDLLEEPPMSDRRSVRNDERVRPAAAAEDAAELDSPTASSAKAAADDFDRPRTAREAELEDEARMTTPGAGSKKALKSTERTAPKPPPRPAGERNRPRPSDEDDAELLPTPPEDE